MSVYEILDRNPMSTRLLEYLYTIKDIENLLNNQQPFLGQIYSIQPFILSDAKYYINVDIDENQFREFLQGINPLMKPINLIGAVILVKKWHLDFNFKNESHELYLRLKLDEFQYVDGIDMTIVRDPKNILKSFEFYKAVERLRRKFLRNQSKAESYNINSFKLTMNTFKTNFQQMKQGVSEAQDQQQTDMIIENTVIQPSQTQTEDNWIQFVHRIEDQNQQNVVDDSDLKSIGSDLVQEIFPIQIPQKKPTPKIIIKQEQPTQTKSTVKKQLFIKFKQADEFIEQNKLSDQQQLISSNKKSTPSKQTPSPNPKSSSILKRKQNNTQFNEEVSTKKVKLNVVQFDDNNLNRREINQILMDLENDRVQTQDFVQQQQQFRIRSPSTDRSSPYKKEYYSPIYKNDDIQELRSQLKIQQNVPAPINQIQEKKQPKIQQIQQDQPKDFIDLGDIFGLKKQLQANEKAKEQIQIQPQQQLPVQVKLDDLGEQQFSSDLVSMLKNIVKKEQKVKHKLKLKEELAQKTSYITRDDLSSLKGSISKSSFLERSPFAEKSPFTEKSLNLGQDSSYNITNLEEINNFRNFYLSNI